MSRRPSSAGPSALLRLLSSTTCRRRPLSLNVERLLCRLASDRLWPGTGVYEGHRKLALAGRAIASEVSILAPQRTHTAA